MAKSLNSVNSGSFVDRKNLIKLDFTEVEQLLDQLVSERENVASANQSAGVICKKAEQEYGYNRQAFKMLATFRKMSDEKRNDYLRTLIGGLEALELMPPKDLVDLAERQAN